MERFANLTSDGHPDDERINVANNDGPAILRLLDSLATADLADIDETILVLDPVLRPMWPGARLIGRARTVSAPSNALAVVRRAVGDLLPGEVLVVDGGRDLRAAVFGETMGRLAQERGAVGAIVDGAVRDIDALRQIGLPVFAAGVIPRRARLEGPGRTGVPVTIAGARVDQGDYIVADSDGVVVIPQSSVGIVIEAASTDRMSDS